MSSMAGRRSQRLRGRSCDHCLEGHYKKANKEWMLDEADDDLIEFRHALQERQAEALFVRQEAQARGEVD